MGAYNPNLNYFLARLQGVSTNYFRLEPQSSGSAAITANKIIRFSLPSNCLLNTRSLSFHFGADANVIASRGGRLPNDISSLIDRVELSSGGVQIAQGMNGYNTFMQMKKSVVCDKCDMALGHPEIVRATSYVDGGGSWAAASSIAALTGVLNENYRTDASQTPFCINQWDGFLGSVQPSIIDTSLLSDLTLTLYLADNSVCPSANGVALSGTGTSDIVDANATGQCQYQIKDFHLVIETLGLADSIYDQMIQSRMEEVGYIELPFKSYYSFSDVHSGNTRFTCSTQSLDRVWAAFRPNDYNTAVAGATVVSGYKKVGAYVSTVAGGATYATPIDVGMPSYDVGGVLNTNAEKYKSYYFNFAEALATGVLLATYQFSFNSSMLPQFRASAEQMLSITRNSIPTLDLGTGRFVTPLMTLDQYRKNYFVMCVRLNLPMAEELREISGLDKLKIVLKNNKRKRYGYTYGNTFRVPYGNTILCC